MSLIHEVSDIFKYKVYPQRWQTIELNKIVKIQNGYAFKSSKFNSDYRGMPLIRIRDIKNSTSETFYDGEILKEYIVFEEDLLIGMDGDFNSNLWKGIPALLNQRVCRLLPDENIILKKLVYYGLPEFLNKINENTSSTTVKHLSSKSIGDIPFPLPPLSEQNRIVEKLDSLFAQLESIKTSMAKIPVLLKNFRQQVLTQAVTGKLTEEWREGKEFNIDLYYNTLIDKKNDLIKNKEVKSEKKMNLILNQEILHSKPISWKYVKLGEITSFINGDRGKNYPNRDEYLDDGVAFINTGHILPNGFLKLEEMNYISEEKYDSLSGGKIKNDDLVYCLRGATLGKTALVEQFTMGAIASSLVIIRPLSLLQKKFIYYYLVSEIGRKYINVYNNGSAQPNLSAENVRNYILGLPPLQEQQQIVSRVEILFTKADAIEEKYKNLKAKIETLPQTILHKAFKGELTEQLESDGDARDLLKEISALKNGEKPKKVAAKKYVQPDEEVLRIVAEPAAVDYYTKVEKTPDWYNQRFELWVSEQGLAARGTLDKATLRELFDAMDDEDK